MNATEAEVDTKALLPCPFCGWEATVVRGGPGNHFIQCQGCRATSDDLSLERAVTAWNRRPALSTLQVQTSEAGWRLVPVEPTEAMLKAAEPTGHISPSFLDAGDDFIANPSDVWASMIEAAPKPPDLREALKPDLALIEATVRKVNPGRSEDHIKSVALDCLSVIRSLSSEERQ